MPGNNKKTELLRIRSTYSSRSRAHLRCSGIQVLFASLVGIQLEYLDSETLFHLQRGAMCGKVHLVFKPDVSSPPLEETKPQKKRTKVPLSNV
jgi:hypothetical protein